MEQVGCSVVGDREPKREPSGTAGLLPDGTSDKTRSQQLGVQRSELLLHVFVERCTQVLMFERVVTPGGVTLTHFPHPTL